MNAIRVEQFGGPEVLHLRQVPDPVPGPGEALVRVRWAGLNFIDIYHRTGLYKNPLPFTPGMEGAGEVVALGPVPPGGAPPDVRPGDRVAWSMHIGAYGELAVVPAWKLVPLPAGSDARTAAASMLQGMTAHYLVRSTFPVQAGQTILVHAAAGGVGLLLVQLGKLAGARVIGTVGTRAKADLARAAGADEVVLYKDTDFLPEVQRLTAGKGVHVVYDGVGRDTWERSLQCLRPRGFLVLFGNASGPVPPVDPLLLSKYGSVYITRPTLAHYAADRAETLARAGEVLALAADGKLSIRVDGEFPLAEVGKAHEALEGRRTTGKLLLRVG